jgi:thiosulfate/3-mercaptopyruvate sulfurtransferase
MSELRSKTLISVADLVVGLDARAPIVLLDVRDDATASNAEGRPRIPGAILVTLTGDFSGPASKAGGKRPLPAIDALQQKAQAWGVNPDSLVVVYDAQDSTQATRAWWTLRWAGFANVRLLDGGFAAWVAAGRPVSVDAALTPKAGSVLLHAGHMPTLEADDAAKLAKDSRLLDARGRANYAAGHIPGSVHAPTSDNVTASGRFKTSEELRTRFAQLGVDGREQVGVYCGSGNAAAHEVAALALIGIEAPLYVGSWSAWSADPARPVATDAPEKRSGTTG